KDIANGIIDRMGPSDLMAVVFTRDNRSTQDFTGDKAKLRAAVAKFAPGTVFMDARLWHERLTSQPELADSDDMYYEASIRTLMNAADFLAAVPHRRKTLVYISQGVPVDPVKAATPILAGPIRPARGQPPGHIAVEMFAIHKTLIDEMNDAFRRA